MTKDQIELRRQLKTEANELKKEYDEVVKRIIYNKSQDESFDKKNAQRLLMRNEDLENKREQVVVGAHRGQSNLMYFGEQNG